MEEKLCLICLDSPGQTFNVINDNIRENYKFVAASFEVRIIKILKKNYLKM